MKKLNSLIVPFLLLATSIDTYASNSQKKFTCSEMSPMTLPEHLWARENVWQEENLWQEYDYYCYHASNAAAIFAEKQHTAASRYRQALQGLHDGALEGSVQEGSGRHSEWHRRGRNHHHL